MLRRNHRVLLTRVHELLRSGLHKRLCSGVHVVLQRRLVSRLLDGPHQRSAMGFAIDICDGRLSIDLLRVVRPELLCVVWLRRVRHELRALVSFVLNLFQLHRELRAMQHMLNVHGSLRAMHDVCIAVHDVWFAMLIV